MIGVLLVCSTFGKTRLLIGVRQFFFGPLCDLGEGPLSWTAILSTSVQSGLHPWQLAPALDFATIPSINTPIAPSANSENGVSFLGRAHFFLDEKPTGKAVLRKNAPVCVCVCLLCLRAAFFFS